MNSLTRAVQTSWIALCLLCSALNAGTLSETEAIRPPNVVLLLADDLGYGDLGCYGHPYARTPALDQLAAEGTRFTQFYVTGTTCNPSRTGLMTGRHPARFPRYAADFGFSQHRTITDILNDHGYATGHFGKWHIGPDTEPGTYGIDTIEVIGKSKNSEAGRDDDLYTAAIQFIQDHEEQPFYVNVWGHATHFPVNPPPGHADAFAGITTRRADFSATMQHKFDQCLSIGGDLDTSMRRYLADLHQIDTNVGRVLKTLDRLGLTENTIVVFSSDHGPAPVILSSKGAREFSNNMLGYAGIHRGGKHTQYEGGVRVPFIVRWPGQIPAGKVDTRNVGSFIDWLPTLCRIADIEELPSGLDGEDLSDQWRGGVHERATPLFWRASAPNAAPAMRLGDWKLHGGHRRAVPPELYDLSVDPSESNNLAEERPDILQRLTPLLAEWNASLPADYEKRRNRKAP